MRFSGKKVLVTGATPCVGREAARLFAEHGAAVIATGRDEIRGKAVVEELATASATARHRRRPERSRRPTLTPAMDPMADMLPTFVAAIPLGRAARPTEIAHAIAYLCSEDASFITGAIVPVDGGRQSVL